MLAVTQIEPKSLNSNRDGSFFVVVVVSFVFANLAEGTDSVRFIGAISVDRCGGKRSVLPMA